MNLGAGGDGLRPPPAVDAAGIFTFVNKMKPANLFTLVAGRRAADDAAPEQRHFQPPWLVEDLTSCFVVKARGGQELAFVYYEEDPRRRLIVKLLSRDEARRVAAAIAKLPEMV
jgi:hypothetical protein